MKIQLSLCLCHLSCSSFSSFHSIVLFVSGEYIQYVSPQLSDPKACRVRKTFYCCYVMTVISTLPCNSWTRLAASSTTRTPTFPRTGEAIFFCRQEVQCPFHTTGSTCEWCNSSTWHVCGAKREAHPIQCPATFDQLKLLITKLRSSRDQGNATSMSE